MIRARAVEEIEQEEEAHEEALKAKDEVVEQQKLRIAEMEEQKARLESRHTSSDSLESLFKFYDRDGSGELSLAEFKLACQLTIDDDAVVEEVFTKLDKDGDQSMDLEEFKAGFAHLKEQIQQSYQAEKLLRLEVAALGGVGDRLEQELRVARMASVTSTKQRDVAYSALAESFTNAAQRRLVVLRDARAKVSEVTEKAATKEASQNISLDQQTKQTEVALKTLRESIAHQKKLLKM